MSSTSSLFTEKNKLLKITNGELIGNSLMLISLLETLIMLLKKNLFLILKCLSNSYKVNLELPKRLRDSTLSME